MWQLASPGEPLQAVAPSMAQTDLLAHARLQANYLNEQMGRKVVGGSVLAAFLQGGAGGGEGPWQHLSALAYQGQAVRCGPWVGHSAHQSICYLVLTGVHP